MIGLFALMVGARSAIDEHNRFQTYLAALPEGERQAAMQRRADQAAAAKAERARREYLEAIKPHTLWSFLGLSRK